MYSKQKSGINGAMGVVNNNLSRRNENIGGRIKTDYEPGTNYNRDKKMHSYAKSNMGKMPQEHKILNPVAQRTNSKIQPRSGGSQTNVGQIKSQNNGKKEIQQMLDNQQSFSQSNEKYLLQCEVEKLNQQLMQMKKIMVEKDAKIEDQRSEITNLRTKNFEFRSQVQELKDKAKDRKDLKQKESSKTDALRQLQMAMQVQNQEVKNREREIMMQVLMNSMAGQHSAEAEEERLLQKALEESKQDAPNDPSNPNTDNMTYEQLLELEENNGKVSKGLSSMDIYRIPEKTWLRKSDFEEESCSICFDSFEKQQKIKKLKNCGHEYHSKCLKKWLTDQKRCPVCNEDAI